MHFIGSVAIGIVITFFVLFLMKKTESVEYWERSDRFNSLAGIMLGLCLVVAIVIGIVAGVLSWYFLPCYFF